MIFFIFFILTLNFEKILRMLQKLPDTRPTAKYLREVFDLLPYMAQFNRNNSK